ncbi:hypothetical protein ACFQ21_17380 [Ohtaekwangia kribbensis]|uniref:Uncharacterized protein n=1 Tax=Ohtaekwangia kribbensis TaxID=688913 RepID=A0ABW3K557_9BACT
MKSTFGKHPILSQQGQRVRNSHGPPMPASIMLRHFPSSPKFKTN